MTSQANHVTQNVGRTKLAQYLTLVKVSSNSIGWLMRKSTNKIGWKEKKKKKKNRRNTVGDTKVVFVSPNKKNKKIRRNTVGDPKVVFGSPNYHAMECL